MTSSVQAMRVFPDGELGGTIRVPGDKSISHRVAMLAGIGEGTSVIEALVLGEEDLVQSIEPLGAFDNRTILRLLCEATPRVIFPDRPIGRLEPGFEASFLVLDGNPLESLAHLRAIDGRYHKGLMIPAEN